MIEVTVYASHLDRVEGRSALRKRIDFEDSLDVDQNGIVRAMRCLFGSKCVIDFLYVP